MAEVGQTPSLSAIENPTSQAGPVSMPMPAPEPAQYNPNSLWRSGARAFFKDQRAARVGDILTVLVEITDRAKFNNSLKRDRDAYEALGLNALFGFEKDLLKMLNEGVDLCKIVDVDSAGEANGAGTIDRKEDVTTKIAAVVTQVLPNGNMVIEGRQEIRVNYEMRELIVAGVVRPEDITSENTISDFQDRRSACLRWRTRTADGCAATALRPAGAGYPAAFLGQEAIGWTREEARRCVIPPSPLAGEKAKTWA